MTRDPTGADDAWGSPGPAGPRHPALPPDGTPGYEFEGRRARPARESWRLRASPTAEQRTQQRTQQRAQPRAAGRRPARRALPPPSQGLAPAQAPAPGARKFKYTPTISQPMPAPRPRSRETPVPGFEFDSRMRSPLGPAPPPPLNQAPPRSRPGPGPGPAGRPRTAERPGTAEWAKLLRSFVPKPAKRSWLREFRQALVFRGWALRVGVPIVAMMIFGVAVVVIAEVNNGISGPAPAASALGFPPATLAGSQFTAAANGRGISQVMGRVASDGTEIVAVGSQAGARIARAQFYVSMDDGLSWAMGKVQAPDGGPPPPGHAARYVAGGRGAWVAIGTDAIWTSGDGRTWTLSAGMPLLAGDRINVVKRTAAGFIAAGANAQGPVVFLSANGVSWQRLGAAQLRLRGTALAIRYAAAAGNLILVSGDVAGNKSGAWLSRDGGRDWAQVTVPAGHGAQAQITGLAAVGNGFVLIRPARAGKVTAAYVYRSPNGTSWTFAATLKTRAGFSAGMVSGGQSGAAITGQTGTKALIAFVTANGATWQQTPAFGSAAAESVAGVSLAGGGAVVTGTTTGDPASRAPLITLVPAHGNPQPVAIAKIQGAADPQLAVNAVAAADGTQVAVGGVNGFPAAWTSTDGGSMWTRAASQAFSRPGVQQLTSVAHGTAGWLAVGTVIGTAAEHPVVVVSADGRAWRAADGQAAFAGAGLVTVQAAAGRAGYVIVGYQKAGNSRAAGGFGGVVPPGSTAAAWWSATPAGRWQRAGVATQDAQMLAATAACAGFVAVGSHGNQASTWASRDGRTWSQRNLPLPAGYAAAVLQHVASNGRTVVAVGAALTMTGRQVPFAAASADGGATWFQAALPVPAGRGFQATATALAASGHDFTATGTFGSTRGRQDVVVWTSASGSGWKTATPSGQGLTGQGIQAITGLTVAGSTAIGVGFTASPGGEQPVFWQFPVR